MPQFDTDEKLKRVVEDVEKKIREQSKDFEQTIGQISGVVTELKDEVVTPLRLEVKGLGGKLEKLDERINGLATSVELEKMRTEVRDITSGQIKAHEKEKHSKSNAPPGNGGSTEIKISLPFKLVTGSFGAGGGAALIYWLISTFLAK